MTGDGLSGVNSNLMVDGNVVAASRGPTLVGVAAGSNGAGSITVTGAAVGDKVNAVTNLTTPALATSSFEATVSVANQVQQTSASNLSGSTYQFILVPQS